MDPGVFETVFSGKIYQAAKNISIYHAIVWTIHQILNKIWNSKTLHIISDLDKAIPWIS